MPSKAPDRYQWDSIEGVGERSIVELAGPFGRNSIPELEQILFDPSIQLFLNSLTTQVGSGDVSSNLRFKHDKEINNEVVKNTLVFLEFYRKLNVNPVVITSYSRGERVCSFKMNEDGSMNVENTHTDGREPDKEDILQSFFDRVSLTQNRRQKMRMSSEGAHFYTYLADLLSLITQVDYYHHPEMFEKIELAPDVVNTLTKEEYGLVEEAPCKYRLTKVEKGGRTWVPNEGFDYLYFTRLKKESSQPYMLPKEGSVIKVSHQMWELLRPGENGTKKMVREHFVSGSTYKRWSDYSVNDVDDGITMCAIYHAFLYSSTDVEKTVCQQVHGIVNCWLDDLDEE